MRHSVCDNKHLIENIHVSRTPAGLINWKAADDFIASVTSVIIQLYSGAIVELILLLLEGNDRKFTSY